MSQLSETVKIAYLLTESNTRVYVQPVALFALLSIGSGRMTSGAEFGWTDLTWAFALAELYLWLYVLHFDISNQKKPDSIEEDKLNKPWRPIPSARLSIKSAERWYAGSSILLLFISGTWFGGFPEAIAFMLETWVHDHAGGGDLWWTKNLMNTLFYSTGQLGATHVAARQTASVVTRECYEWCFVLALVIFTTIHIQDFRDQEGDKIRGRKTMPLVAGDTRGRWITAATICSWSLFCPFFWTGSQLTAGSLVSILTDSFVAGRLLWYRTPVADRLTLFYYSMLWCPSLYSIPLLIRYQMC